MPKKGNTKKRRFTMRASSDFFEIMKRLRERTKARTDTEVVHRAINLYDMLLSKSDSLEGRSGVILRDEKGRETRLFSP